MHAFVKSCQRKQTFFSVYYACSVTKKKNVYTITSLWCTTARVILYHKDLQVSNFVGSISRDVPLGINTPSSIHELGLSR